MAASVKREESANPVDVGLLGTPAVVPGSQESRWKVELFLKWIKQHLRIKAFCGNSENAVKTQL